MGDPNTGHDALSKTAGQTNKSTINGGSKLQPTVIDWKHIDVPRFLVLAPTASVLTRVVLYPTQLIKTRLQVQKQHSFYNGPVDAFRKIVRYEGVRALYKGFLPNLINVGAGQLYITSYERIKHRLTPVVPNEIGRNFIGGFSASMISQVIMVPANVVTQRMMVFGQTVEQGATHEATTARSLASNIIKAEGVRGFYKGYWASIAAFAPTSAIWWSVYGVLRRWQSGDDVVKQDMYTIAQQAVAGSLAGITTAVITNPLDVVRARLQVDGRVGDGIGWTRVFAQLWKEEGMSGMYKGVTARMGYMGVNSLLMISAYEMVKRLSLKEDVASIEEVEDDIATEACSS
eukprot:m.39138 g.39138  ORF g.39138 m.39138 type:complete len:345 (-) comp10268_c0_seq2:92-1126(-)